MPRVWELIKQGEPCKLAHPTIGNVAWENRERGEGWGLYFEDGRVLGAFEDVFFDAEWHKTGEPETAEEKLWRVIQEKFPEEAKDIGGGGVAAKAVELLERLYRLEN